MRKKTITPDTLFPASYIDILMGLVEEKGVDTGKLLANYNLTRQELQIPRFQLALHASADITGLSIMLCECPELGFQFGERIHLASHGDLGIAVLSSQNYQQAMELTMRYSQTRVPYIKLALSMEGGYASVKVIEVIDLGPIRQFCIETTLSSQFAITKFLLGKPPEDAAIRIAYEEPEYSEFYQKWLTPNICFNAEATELIFPKEWLDLPLAMSSPSTRDLSIARIKQEGGGPGKTVIEIVRHLILESLANGITLEEVSGRLNMSSRTLIRKLSEQKTTFKALLLEIRQNKARYLLGQTNLPLEEISDLLGYKDPANFTRAFKKWMEMAPSEYRVKNLKA